MTNKVLKSGNKGRSTGRAIIQMTTFVLNHHRARRFPDDEKYTEISSCFLRKGCFSRENRHCMEPEDEKNTVNERRSEDEESTYVNFASSFFVMQERMKKR